MAQSETPAEDNLEQYRSTSGAETKTVSSVRPDEHDLKEAVGEGEDAQQRKYDAEIAGERFVNFYDDPAAGIREFLSNAETACIRRAKAELRDAGAEVPGEVAAVIEKAKEVAGYEPVIEVTYNRDPNQTTLTIEDNGIGISAEEYQVLQRVGYSASHTDGDVAGQFGIGFMSGFLLCGIHEGFDLTTHSYEDGSNYATTEFLANFEYANRTKDGFGTRFDFETFCHKAEQEINVPDAVARYSEGMRVPVIYTDLDSDGNQTSRSDDYTARNIEDDYPDDALVIIYEDEFVKAVMSPEDSNRRGRTTYNVIMPIRRNCDEWGSEPKFDAPWKWDVRVKKEDGPIVHVPDDAELPEWADSTDDLIGLSPIDDQKYPRLTDRQKDDAIRRSELPEGAVTSPRPASSRDSFEAGNDDFWSYVADKLAEQWQAEATAMLDSLDTFEDYVELDASDKSLVNRAYSDYAPSTTQNAADTINETLEENLGITMPDDVALKMEKLRHKTRHVPRGTDEPRLKGNSVEKKVWKIIDAAGSDDVYMGCTITDKKAEIAWGLSDNTQVVRVESTDEYEKWGDLFGWKKLKELPSSNFSEKLPELDDDVADKWENKSTSNNSSSGSSSRRTSRDPTTRRIKVRSGRGKSRYFSTVSAGTVYDELDSGNTVSAGRFTSADALIIVNQNEHDRVYAATKHADRSHDVAAALVPTYVYNYLVDADNVYESLSELKTERAKETIDLSDGSTKQLRDLSSDDVLVFAPKDFREKYGDDLDVVKEQVAKRTNTFDVDDVDSFTLVSPQVPKNNYYGFKQCDATMIRLDGARASRKHTHDYVQLNEGTLVLETELPDADFDSDEFQYIFGTETPKDTEAFRNTIELIKQAGGTFPSQDE